MPARLDAAHRQARRQAREAEMALAAAPGPAQSSEVSTAANEVRFPNQPAYYFK
jgi:hypothetical protein